MTPPIYKTVPYVLHPTAQHFVREDPPPPATFTQEQVDAFMAKERRKLEEKYGDYEKIKEEAGKVGDLAKKVTALTEAAEMADKTKEEQATLIAQRAAAQSEAELTALRQQVLDATGLTEKAVGALHQFRMTTHVGASLATAGVLQSASAHAQSAMLADMDIKLGDDGKIESITYDGVPQTDLAAASAKWLGANKHFKTATPGGGGTETPNSGTITPEDRENMSADELASRGWETPPIAASGGPKFDE